VFYPDTADCYSLYHALLNASLCLIQVSLSNSLFSFKSAYFEYVLFLDPILPRSSHDFFAWIDNFDPFSFQNNSFYFSSAFFGISMLLSHLLSMLPFYASSFLYIPLQHIYAGILPYCSSVIIYLCRYSSYCGSVTIYLCRYSSTLW
jgi:hypothetical protein